MLALIAFIWGVVIYAISLGVEVKHIETEDAEPPLRAHTNSEENRSQEKILVVASN